MRNRVWLVRTSHCLRMWSASHRPCETELRKELVQVWPSGFIERESKLVYLSGNTSCQWSWHQVWKTVDSYDVSKGPSWSQKPSSKLAGGIRPSAHKCVEKSLRAKHKSQRGLRRFFSCLSRLFVSYRLPQVSNAREVWSEQPMVQAIRTSNETLVRCKKVLWAGIASGTAWFFALNSFSHQSPNQIFRAQSFLL